MDKEPEAQPGASGSKPEAQPGTSVTSGSLTGEGLKVLVQSLVEKALEAKRAQSLSVRLTSSGKYTYRCRVSAPTSTVAMSVLQQEPLRRQCSDNFMDIASREEMSWCISCVFHSRYSS